MIKSTKWYGLIANSPEEYFNQKCHSYSDITSLLDRKGIDIIKDIAPCIESFIKNEENRAAMPNELAEKLILANDFNANNLFESAVEYTIDNMGNLKAYDDTWYVWTDIPRIRYNYRTGKINDESDYIFSKSLESFASKVMSNLSTMDSLAVEDAVNEFNNYVTYSDIINWDTARESIANESEIACHVGDMIVDASKDDWYELAREGVMSDIDICLDDIAEEVAYKNPDRKGDKVGYKTLITDIWSELTEATEETFDNALEDIYRSRKMKISIESYVDAIHDMVKMGCLPNLESITPEHYANMKSYLNGEYTPATEGLYVDIKDREYNLELWDRKPGYNILWVTGFPGSGKSTYAKNLARKTTDCIYVDSDRFVCSDEPIFNYGENAKEAALLKKFHDDYVKKNKKTIADFLGDIGEDHELLQEKQLTGIFFDWIEKEAAKNPSTLYIVEGVWIMYDVSPEYLVGRPVVIIGTSIHKSTKRASLRDGRKYDSLGDRYSYKSADMKRKKFIETLNQGITESAMLKTSYPFIEATGYIPGIAEDMKALEEFSFEYIPSYEYDEASESGKRLSTKIREKYDSGAQKISNAYKKYKDNEEVIDERLTRGIKNIKDAVAGNPEDARRVIVEGKGSSVLSVLKTALGGVALFSVSKIAFLLVLIVRLCNGGKIKNSEKKKITHELESELKVLDQKIQYAKMDGNREAVYDLMRTKSNVQQAIRNIKRKESADTRKYGIGASDVLLGKRGG